MLAAADQSLEALLASDSGSNQAPSVPDTSATEDEGGNGRGGAAALQGLRLDPAYSDSSLSSSRSSSAGGGGGGGSSKGGSRMGGGGTRRQRKGGSEQKSCRPTSDCKRKIHGTS